MASNWPNNPESVLRGLWGSLVSAAEGGRDATTMWSALKTAANNWASSVLAVTSQGPVSEEDIAAKSRQLIGGVTVQDMNKYVRSVGEFLRAKQNLQSLGTDLQITGDAIFTPPWATTVGNPAVPTRYRIRVLREIEVRGFTRITRQEWSTYELTGPLTNVADALAQANTLFSLADYNARASITQVLDYSIEAV